MWTGVCKGETDLEKLKRQTREFEFSGLNTDRMDLNQAAKWAAQLDQDGKWSYLNYTDQTRDYWKTEMHLKQTRAMATLYAEEKERGQSDAPLAAAVLSAAHYWIIHDFRNPNWWQNQIQVPRDMVTILLMMEEEMSPQDKAAALKITERATISMTGQNKVWMAGIVFRRALLEGDMDLARKARETILDGLKVTNREGLQADESFQQHGPQQQMGNYGLAFATEMVDWADIWRDTALAMPDDKMALLRDFLLRGEAPVTDYGAMDISACGRQLFPDSPLKKGSTVIELLNAMAQLDAAHAQDYQMAAKQDSQPPGGTMNWNFFRSDYMVHRRWGYYVSVKLCSNRVIGGEKVNGENLSGRYLADGALFLYQTGKEYSDIFPVWDWRRIPGVTCMTTGTTLAPAGKMATDFAGGVSDGTYGAEGLDYRRDEVSGKKGWFFLDDEVACLGAGITGTNAITTVDQRLAEGPILTSAGSLARGLALRKGVDWILHGGEGYLFPQPQDVWAGMQPQTGSWKNVYTAGSDTKITRDVFSIWIDQTASPTYAYIVMPGASAEKLQAYVKNPRVEILSNTPEVQAVREADVTEAVFYNAGRLQAGNLSMEVDGPCAIILRGDTGYVADPTQKEKAVTVTINGKATPVALPVGDMAGSTVKLAE
jgi:chondroitin AC lyase